MKKSTNLLSCESLFDKLFIFSISYVALASITTMIFAGTLGEDPGIASVYYLFINLSVAIYLTYLFLNREKKSFQLKKTIVYSLLVVSSVFAISRFLTVEKQLLWQDEYTQFKRSITKSDFPTGLARFGVRQQQPPIDYYMSSFSHLIFGKTFFAIKFHTIFFSFLFFLALYLSSLSLTKNLGISLLTTIYAISSNSLTYYTLEARPHSLSILFGLFSIHYLLKSLLLPNNSLNLKVNFSFLFFVLSIGLQPQILMITIYFSILIMVLLGYKYINYKKIFFIFCFIAFLFSPYFYLIYVDAITQDQFNPFTLDRFLSTVSDLKVSFGEFYVSVYSYSKDYSMSAFPFYYIFLISIVVIIYKFRNIKWKKDTQFLFLLFLTLSFFPLIFNIIFKFFINWPQWPRYMSVYYIPYFLFLSLFLTKIVNLKLISSKKIFLHLVILLAITFNFFTLNSTILDRNSWKADWKKAYQYLNKKLTEKDIALYLNLNENAYYPRPTFILNDIYVKQNKRHLYSFMDRELRGVELGYSLSNKVSKNVTLVFEFGHFKQQILDGMFANIPNKKKFQNLLIVELHGKNIEIFIKNIENTLVKEIKSPKIHLFFDIIISYYNYSENFKKAYFWHNFLEEGNYYQYQKSGFKQDLSRFINNKKKVFKRILGSSTFDNNFDFY